MSIFQYNFKFNNRLLGLLRFCTKYFCTLCTPIRNSRFFPRLENRDSDSCLSPGRSNSEALVVIGPPISESDNIFIRKPVKTNKICYNRSDFVSQFRGLSPAVLFHLYFIINKKIFYCIFCFIYILFLYYCFTLPQQRNLF